MIIYTDEITGEALCFRHAVLRAINGKDIDQHDYSTFVTVADAKCVDCTKNDKPKEKKDE